MANACTALNTVTRKPGLSGFFSSSERTSWHISAGVAVFENCDVEEEEEDEEEKEVLLLDVVRLSGAALLRSSSFPPSLWSFEDLETLPLLRRLSPPLVLRMGDPDAGGENHRAADPDENVGDFGEDEVTDNRDPDQSDKIDRHYDVRRS